MGLLIVGLRLGLSGLLRDGLLVVALVFASVEGRLDFFRLCVGRDVTLKIGRIDVGFLIDGLDEGFFKGFDVGGGGSGAIIIMTGRGGSCRSSKNR